MNVLTILSALIIATYTAAVCIKSKGIPYSISETFYKIEHKFWFGLTMVLTAGLLMPIILEVTPDSYRFMAFLACTGMMMTGVAPNFREGIEKTIHTTGAVFCLVFSQVWVISVYPYALYVWIGFVIYMVFGMWMDGKRDFPGCLIRRKPLFWAEAASLLTTYITLFNRQSL